MMYQGSAPINSKLKKETAAEVLEGIIFMAAMIAAIVIVLAI
jgi:hypothetical protein